MATYTENLGLEKPDLDDFYDVTKRNDNYDKIDEAIGNLDDDMKDHKTDPDTHANLKHYVKKSHVTDPDAHSEVFNNYVKKSHVTDPDTHANLKHYVKKSGDTMSGNLSKSVNNSSFELYGGSGWANGALLKLNGKENTEKGSFNLIAHNGSEFTELKGTANGSLTWNNKNIVRSVNGVNADAQGNIDLIDLIPCGSYIQHAGDSAPSGFLVCNGGEVSRTTYAKLFSVIGTKYGAGDGSTTFNLPNLINRFLEGSGISGTVLYAGLPNITGDLYSTTTYVSGITTSGCFNHDVSHSFSAVGDRPGVHIDFYASRSSAVYGRSSTVQPDAVTCLICIKY